MNEHFNSTVQFLFSKTPNAIQAKHTKPSKEYNLCTHSVYKIT